MTLDEAIIRAKEASEDQCLGDRGREDYKQIAEWLEELKEYRNKERKVNTEQMFNKLGYTRIECGDPMYRKKDDPWTWIDFSGSGVSVSVENGLGHKYLSSELIEAISQQMKELG